MQAASSGGEQGDDKSPIKKVEVHTNEHSTLCFSRENNQDSTTFSGKLYRTCSELDLLELAQLNQQLDRRTQKLRDIDPNTILGTFGGHTIFSLYSDEISVYRLLLKQISNREYPSSEDADGGQIKNEWLSRLMRLLLIPVTDLVRI